MEPSTSSPTPHFKIVLNTPFRTDLFLQQAAKGDTVICADGGARRLFEGFQSDEQRMEHAPDYILGDMDSLELGTG